MPMEIGQAAREIQARPKRYPTEILERSQRGLQAALHLGVDTLRGHREKRSKRDQTKLQESEVRTETLCEELRRTIDKGNSALDARFEARFERRGRAACGSIEL